MNYWYSLLLISMIINYFILKNDIWNLERNLSDKNSEITKLKYEIFYINRRLNRTEN